METAMKQSDMPLHAKLTQVKVSVDHGIAAAFKAACETSNVSMAAELSRFMADYANASVNRRAATDYSTRRKRRAIVKRILIDLEHMKLAEERLRDNAPENLQDAPVYEAAEEYIEALDEAIAQLGVLLP